MSKWINTKHLVTENITHPCKFLNYCPYGKLVEEYQIRNPQTKISCKIFGHDCPVHYMAELIIEDDE